MLGIAVILLAACAHRADPQSARAKAAQAKIPVGVVTVVRRNIDREIALPGTLVAFYQATLYGKVAGYLRSITVDKGDAVYKGQTLAVLEVPEMVDEVDEARAAYQEALANLNQARAEAELQAVTYQRFSEVHRKDPDAVAKQELDQYRSKFDVAEAEIKLAEAKVATARANLNRLIALHQYADITAPFTGIITARFVDPGALIQAATSSNQGQPIVTLQDLGTIRAYVSVPEVNVPFIHVGAPASLTTAAYPGRVFRAAVTRFADALDPATRTMKTEIDVRNPRHALRPGMYADVTLVLEKVRGAMVIPDSALVIEGSQKFVWLARDGFAHGVEVETGLDNGTDVEIRAGLRAGEQVIVTGKDSVTEGSALEMSSLGGAKL
ncbi:MAG: efflux RND transporter periplasmic adaptor subunit [Acidobacteriota bacterium]|nr:efflux RND transporter periplasmic adaptor subunit [Acidobacteriota bacterium]